MVFIWSSGWGPRRRRHGPGYGRRYGPRYGYGPGYGYGPRRGHDRDGSCLRDLLFLNTGCCLANAIGCGIDGLFLVSTTVRHVHATGTGRRGTRVRDRLVAAVRVYPREVSPRRPPGCRFEPTSAADAVHQPAGQALDQPLPLGVGQAGELERRDRQLHPRVGGVDALAARARRAGEPPVQRGRGHDERAADRQVRGGVVGGRHPASVAEGPQAAAGTGSGPPTTPGRQRTSRRRVSQPPRPAPCRSRAWTA